MSQTPTYAALTYLPDCQQATADQVAEILERWRTRSDDHVSNRRRDLRFPYPNHALVVAAVRFGDVGSAHVSLQVQTRNISCGGISFLAAPQYNPQQPADGTPALSSDRVFVEGNEVLVGMPRAENDYLWMRGTIVRCRVVHFGFRECGVSFVSREPVATTQDSSPARESWA